MNLIACMKRVPDTASQIRVGEDGRSVDPAGITYVVNPYDEFAVEECIKIKEQHGGEVSVLTIGPAESTKEIRHCLAMGADKALHVKDGAAPRDPLSTAKALVAALEGRSFDVLFFGKQAVDHDNAQVGLVVATLLDLPAVAEVVKVEVRDGGGVTVHREAEGNTEVVEVPTPCVLTAQKGLNEPRYPNLKGIMQSKKKPIEAVAVEFTANALEVVAMEPPPARPEGRIVGEGAAAVPELIRALRDEAKVF